MRRIVQQPLVGLSASRSLSPADLVVRGKVQRANGRKIMGIYG